MELTLARVKKDRQINEFIKQTNHYLKELGYTDHGFRHVNIVADRALSLAAKIGLSKKTGELAAIAGYCHDMGNFLGRTQHHYWAAMLFSQIYIKEADPNDLSTIMQAIVNHDKNDLKLLNDVSAILVLADKSDVHRSRVLEVVKNGNMDIHDRVNYSVTDSDLFVEKNKKIIHLFLKVDTKVTSVLEYFEIFTERMTFCRTAAEYLGYRFSLEINNFKLS
ncbi:phosphohydrolase [Candidatus Parcubacteria bacterium]|nr:MAG: phosphohydrolase [Candidatus Parcubacteria bacterium]